MLHFDNESLNNKMYFSKKTFQSLFENNSKPIRNILQYFEAFCFYVQHDYGNYEFIEVCIYTLSNTEEEE